MASTVNHLLYSSLSVFYVWLYYAYGWLEYLYFDPSLYVLIMFYPFAWLTAFEIYILLSFDIYGIQYIEGLIIKCLNEVSINWKSPHFFIFISLVCVFVCVCSHLHPHPYMKVEVKAALAVILLEGGSPFWRQLLTSLELSKQGGWPPTSPGIHPCRRLPALGLQTQATGFLLRSRSLLTKHFT